MLPGLTICIAAAILAACTRAAPPPDASPAPQGGQQGSSPRHTPADVAFMHGMIAHHQQALDMAALVPERTTTEAIRLLAERIKVSQTDEIAQMSRWLERRGESVAPAGDHMAHHASDEPMPGMLTPEEMESLAQARAAEFDRKFLELMIRHHQGALTMVEQLLSTPGAGQEVDVFRIASEIDADQRMEIQRMQQMLDTLG